MKLFPNNTNGLYDYSMEKLCLLWLCSLKGFNGRLGAKLLDVYGDSVRVYEADYPSLKQILTEHALEAFIRAKDDWPLDLLLDKLISSGTQFVCYYDKNFPSKLKNIPDYPLGIFYKGTLPSDNKISVAVIGARECSSYGQYVARDIGAYLGQMGVQVISGMARGIDSISQSAALNEGGISFGVLGSGPDICYPPSNINLYHELIQKGGILSPYPPGEKAVAFNFPPRNRIVSGLADAVIVVEARQKSGTIITVDMALEQGRDVYAVPGRITDRLSDGCNGLIGQGANVFLSPEIFMTEIADKLGAGKTGKLHRSFDGVSKDKKMPKDQLAIYNLLDLSPKDAEEICELLPEGYDYSRVLMILMQLVIDGHATQINQNYFIRRD